MTSPLTRDDLPLFRERHARDELARVGREARHWAEYRRQALWDLKAQYGTWPKVAEATGQNRNAIVKAAYKKPREEQP